jgi:Bardet-Biedl syndrome 1 protein
MSARGGTADAKAGSDSTAEAKKTQRHRDGPWLNAWYDPVANLSAFSPCMCLADTAGDKEFRLLVADSARMLRVFKDTSLLSEHAIMDIPVAMAAFISDVSSPPSIAVASGSYVFIYRNLRPYLKFTLPPVQLESAELDVWDKLKDGNLELPGAVTALTELRESGAVVSSRTLDFLALPAASEEQSKFVAACKGPAIQLTVVTCLDTLNKSKAGPGQVSSLVIGTENKEIFIMDTLGSNIVSKKGLPHVPSFISCIGVYDVEYRIVVACRNGGVYQIKKGVVTGTVIELETPAVGLCVIDTHKTILVACMHNVIHAFNYKGKKQFSIYTPAPITNLSLAQFQRNTVKVALVALANGEVRMYNKKTLLNTLQLEEPVTGMIFGPYHREDGALCLVLKSGALAIKYLRRHTALEEPSEGSKEKDQEAYAPLQLPKKTQVYLEQTEREKEHGPDIHRIFQRDLCRLRLTTAREYVQLITDGHGPLSHIGSASLRLEASVLGLGPLFIIRMMVKNSGAKALTNIKLAFLFNDKIYRIRDPLLTLPVLVPSLMYIVKVAVECVDPKTPLADELRYPCHSHYHVLNPDKLINLTRISSRV